LREVAKLIIDGKELLLPVVEGSEGEKAIDIRRLRQETGCITFDPGYGNTGSCESARSGIQSAYRRNPAGNGIYRGRYRSIEKRGCHSLTKKPPIIVQDFTNRIYMMISLDNK